MIIEIIFVIILLYVGFVFLKMEHHTRKLKILLIVGVVLLIYVSVMNIFSSDRVDLTSPRGIIKGVYLYVGWIGTTISNLWDVGKDTVGMVGEAVKTENSTGGR